ncbi:MAG: hypothetical protein KAS99_06565 [Candidatus Omnitrophica bacterium]|nr:hypothetical protein [Candidatus Omnitrophota bacterium]
MGCFLYIFCAAILLIYVIILHLCWGNKKRSYLKKLKEDEAQLVHLEKMASLGVLSAGIAHEINNPLTFLITSLYFLSNHVKKEDVQGKESFKSMNNSIEICIEGANRIKKIVKDLLFFSHPSMGQKVLTDINLLLEATLRILWNEIKHKVDVVKDYKASSHLWIDSSQISQVFLNLMMNAAQAIKEKGTIHLSTYEDEKNLFVKISDTGCGIPEEVSPKIFNPFFTTKGGTGLGLYVSNNIILRCKGTMNFESTPDKGTSFTISFSKDKD